MSTQYDTGVTQSASGPSITLDRVMLTDTSGSALATAAGVLIRGSLSPSATQPVSGTVTSVVTAVQTSYVDAVNGSSAVSVKSSAGALYSITVANVNASARYLQFHNSAAVPAAGSAPVFCMPIPAGSTNAPGYLSLGRNDFGDGGRQFSVGISVGVSTVASMFTAATAVEHQLTVSYI